MKSYFKNTIRILSSFLIINSQFSISFSQVKFTVIQINDVYEIAGLQNGKIGDMARAAALKKQYAAKNPNTFMLLSGDFVSPSALNKVKYQGDQLQGRQMIDVMNAAGVDFVTFGNHEFDIKENFLLKRIAESKSEWISSNVMHVTKGDTVPFEKANGTPFPRTLQQTLRNKKGEAVLVGWFGLTLPANRVAHVYYQDYTNAAKDAVALLKYDSDVIIGITHLSREMDSTLAQDVKDIDVIMGGHEHEWMKFYSGKTLVTKADANAKTAWVHQFCWNVKSKEMKVKSKLVALNEKITPDPEVEKIVQTWMDSAFVSMAKSGIDPRAVLMTTDAQLDGREGSIRNSSTLLTRLVADALQWYSPGSDAIVYNSGSIRVDDILTGEITQYDIVRTLPFGGAMVEVTMSGAELKKVLTTGTTTTKGTGAYLQMANITFESNVWKVRGAVIDDKKIYKVLMPTFLVTVGDTGLEFITKFPNAKPTGAQEGVVNDFQNITIDYIKSVKPTPK